jgi:putative resolvase
LHEGVKLAEWARGNGVHPQTAYRWFREEKMPVPARRLEPGTIWVSAALEDTTGRVVLYARVSSHDQRSDLDRHVARLTSWATRNGHEVGEVVTEVGSGVEHLEAALGAHGRRIVVADPGEATDDLVRDMIEVCARLYGRRGARNRAMRAVTATKSGPGGEVS